MRLVKHTLPKKETEAEPKLNEKRAFSWTKSESEKAWEAMHARRKGVFLSVYDRFRIYIFA